MWINFNLIELKMKNLFLFFSISLIASFSVYSQTGIDSLTMYIPKGQTSGKYFQVFIPGKNISRDMHPKLILNTPSKNTLNQIDKIAIISTNQILREDNEDIQIYSTGTWIYFDISNLNIPELLTSLKVIPIVEWEEKKSDNKVRLVYSSYYFIGNGIGTAIWTAVTIFLFIAIIFLFVKQGKGSFLGIICGKDGRMSMSLLQMALWTIAVGTMVLAFGLLRLEVPNIPDTLIMLILFAAATTTVGQFQTISQNNEKKELDNERKKNKILVTEDDDDVNTKIGKFRTIFYSNKEDKYPSIAKVQVLFWTVIALLLFVYLSLKEKKLWDVPSELVFLMGISQATYLGRKQIAIQSITTEKNNLKKENKENVEDD